MAAADTLQVPTSPSVRRPRVAERLPRPTR